MTKVCGLAVTAAWFSVRLALKESKLTAIKVARALIRA